MKKGLILFLLLALLIGLIAGGSILYRQLSPGSVDSADDGTTELRPTERHRSELSDSTDLIIEGEETVEPTSPAESLSESLTADFQVQDENGQMVHLSDFFGKPMVVNFWATWCPPCRMELPYFDKAALQYEGQVQFMMVNMTDGYNDTVESATAFIREENNYSFPLFFDVEFSGAEAYQINAIPVILFIQADGSLLHQQIGAMDEETLLSYIEQLLA